MGGTTWFPLRPEEREMPTDTTTRRWDLNKDFDDVEFRNERNERALREINKLLAPLQFLAARHPAVFRDMLLAAFKNREECFFDTVGRVVDESRREIRSLLKDETIPYQMRDLLADLMRFDHGAANVRTLTGDDKWRGRHWPIHLNDKQLAYDEGYHTTASDLLVDELFRDEQPSRTVKEARQRLATRTGRSMRSVIAETIHMEPAQIDAIAA